MYFLHGVEMYSCRRRAAQSRSPARENLRRPGYSYALLWQLLFRPGLHRRLSMCSAPVAPPAPPAGDAIRSLPAPPPRPRLRRGYPYPSAGTPYLAPGFNSRRSYTPFRHPHPARAFVKGYPYVLCRHPHPARAFAGISIHLSGNPYLAPGFNGRHSYTPFRHPPPTRASVCDYPYPSAGTPTPPAPSALRPRPLPQEGVRACDIRGAAVSGVEPVDSRARFFSRLSPCTGPWGYRHGGWRLAGRGRAPSPVSHAPDTLLLAGILHPLLACGGSARRISGEQPYPGFSRRIAVSGSFPPIPVQWTVGLSPWGVAARREGACPLPCLSRSRHLASRRHPPPRPRLRRDTHTLLAGHPHPAPWGGRGSARAYIR